METSAARKRREFRRISIGQSVWHERLISRLRATNQAAGLASSKYYLSYFTDFAKICAALKLQTFDSLGILGGYEKLSAYPALPARPRMHRSTITGFYTSSSVAAPSCRSCPWVTVTSRTMPGLRCRLRSRSIRRDFGHELLTGACLNPARPEHHRRGHPADPASTAQSGTNA